MKASELIEQLSKLITKHGDCEIEVSYFDHEHNSEYCEEIHEVSPLEQDIIDPITGDPIDEEETIFTIGNFDWKHDEKQEYLDDVVGWFDDCFVLDCDDDFLDETPIINELAMKCFERNYGAEKASELIQRIIKLYKLNELFLQRKSF